MPMPLSAASYAAPPVDTARYAIRNSDCRAYGVRSQLVRDDEPAPNRELFSGWAGMTRLLVDGRRQIVHLVLPGESLNVMAVPNGASAYPIVALTSVLVTPVLALDESESARRTAQAFWYMQNQICRLGRQNAYERLAHLIVELRDRVARTGRSMGDSFEMPLTQDTLADVLGLTSVHVNRTLQQMRRDGLIRLTGRTVTIIDRAALERIAEYRALPGA